MRGLGIEKVRSASLVRVLGMNEEGAGLWVLLVEKRMDSGMCWWRNV